MTEATSAMSMGTALKTKGKTRRFMRNFPGFVYILIVYVLVGLLVPDTRAILFTVFGSYSLTTVEILYLLGTFTAMAELLRVSKPGIDNTIEALFMLGVGIVYLFLLMLGALRIPGFGIFGNTEFLMLTMISAFQVIMAFIINARTLKRTFDTSSAINDSDV